MTFEALLDKLIQVERAVASGDTALARMLTMQAEEMVLQIEQDTICGLEQKQLRQLRALRGPGFGR